MLGLSEKFSWRNSTIMAKASFNAYQNLTAFQKEFDPEAVMFDNDGTQVFCWQDGGNACVVFRGTEPLSWDDIKSDLKIRRTKVPTGFVHRGFKDALDKVWEDIANWLVSIKQPNVFFCGHSLGGALATLAASRWNTTTTHLYTFGSPRVGGEKFVKSFNTNYRYRFRNNNDIVTRVPPEWIGYKHASGNQGHFIYFDVDGLPREGFSRGFMFMQWMKGTYRGFFQNKTWDAFQDHNIGTYYRLCREKMVEESVTV
jgi:triacylglycerol lipase